ncbi:hypothetical protein LEP1GSC058_0945 [Leptospira fainei serovar Hurstbridge str. BUT 6]|uniref:Uncharacterized protein n=1 Tax=Leptospira fainei serovar Hurstbridge str. BUT 6 TaxID=1193011 RepID=S3UQF2_9LEPT|nr:hypothetical protein LEP1GSC058_0945 [Leptospira fainei serovar Hurstbridge str. BUT 6]
MTDSDYFVRLLVNRFRKYRLLSFQPLEAIPFIRERLRMINSI